MSPALSLSSSYSSVTNDLVDNDCDNNDNENQKKYQTTSM